MTIYLVSIIVGLAVLTWSADRFIAGASVTARSLGVPPLIVGLTVVGIGTSLPEMLVSTMAALDGNAGIAVGNAIGSNIANVGLILGITALITPLTVSSGLLRRELPMLLLITAVVAVLLLDLQVGRLEGGLLLLGMLAVVVWMGWQAQRSDEPPDVIGAEFEETIPSDVPLSRALLWLVAGLALLLASSRLLVWAAVGVAEALGVSDLVIGLTIVAVGTSLPELAAGIASARHGEHDIAIGNIIGSNMFNLLAVLGIAGAIAPFALERVALVRDYSIMAALTVLFAAMAFGLRGPGRITRIEGGLLLAAFAGYQGLLFASGR
ncbi:calcium/sodium antiporter [Sediminicurvatus halobius]|uniref:Calcium/sodium antiporter n=1 Tax=Sediminicurvatus halobius TaxID=2182432 RepID=A0A2U2N7N0_9GAMM|nr:calcium/sodium antiporter [Spiribacter halobius]PWG65201.1 calcium/sodium antiporter [Spiribacter halobius]UEX78845.1 calcium/sodium antiporter [Spiribacter halobius]